MNTTEFGGRVESVYDPELHDGDLENVHAICLDFDGSIIDSDDDLEFMEFGDYFSVFLHLRDGGMDCVGNFKTLKEAQAYRDGHATNYINGQRNEHQNI